MAIKEQTTLRLLADDARKTFRQAVIRERSVISLALSVLVPLVLAATSILVFPAQQAGLTATIHLYHPRIARHPGSSQPTPSPTPGPVPFLPNTLGGQIATLQDHDRFFYNGNTSLPEIALTFDDGPNPSNTPQILAILKKYQVHATFFDLGRLVKLYPDLARQEIAGGHVVGDHTWSHPNLPFLTPNAIRAQIKDTYDAIQQVTGEGPIFFRPPYGDLSVQTLKIVNNFGLSTVIWNNDARDWSLPGTAQIERGVLSSVRNGTIILLHDGGGNRLQTIGALPTIIEHLRARHFRFVTMAEMAAHAQSHEVQPTPTPGRSRQHPFFFAWQRAWCRDAWDSRLFARVATLRHLVF